MLLVGPWGRTPAGDPGGGDGLAAAVVEGVAGDCVPQTTAA